MRNSSEVTCNDSWCKLGCSEEFKVVYSLESYSRGLVHNRWCWYTVMYTTSFSRRGMTRVNEVVYIAVGVGDLKITNASDGNGELILKWFSVRDFQGITSVQTRDGDFLMTALCLPKYQHHHRQQHHHHSGHGVGHGEFLKDFQSVCFNHISLSSL